MSDGLEHRGAASGDDVNRQVLDSARKLLAQRDERVGDVESSVIAGEIANDTDLDKDVVMAALVRLGRSELHIKSAADDKEIEVLGVVEEAGPDTDR